MKNVSIKDVVDFYNEHPEEIGNLSVETRFGFKQIQYADVTAYDSEMIEIETSSHKKLIGSPDHKIFSGQQWVFLRDIQEGDYIETKDGIETIHKKLELNGREDLYDLQVEEVHEFYANDIVSHNSAFLDAVVFALFGRPYRKIKKPSLINSINDKNLVVEIEFNVGGKEFFVRRGMKPAVFEIFENGKKIDESGSIKDQQKYFEENILKTNYRSFLQIVILGANNYIPFMELRTQQRREFIEQLLDIDIFSTMNDLLKSRFSLLKQVEQSLHTKISKVEHEISTQQNFVDKLQRERNNQSESIDKEIDELNDEIEKIQKDKEKYQRELENIDQKINDIYNVELSGWHDADKASRDVQKRKASFNSRIETLKEDIKVLNDNSTCPTCYQEITEEHRHETIESWNSKIEYFNSEIAKIQNEQEQIENILERLREKNSEKQNYQLLIKNYQNDIDRVKRNIQSLEKKKSNVPTEDIETEKQVLKDKKQQLENLKDRQKVVDHKRSVLNVASDLLKDTGIKSRIVSQYVPIINKLINQYLSIMGYPITFTLDQNFEEKIYSRHRESFMYDNFSEGEKQRIDIALLMTWRDIARMKNSVSTNLLILDEVFDSSLDSSGMENYLSVLDELEDSNVYIISHRLQASSVENADRILYVQKKKDFSYISNSNGDLLVSS